ncbi:LysE family translocator [Roseomonas genomospecies 6]|uniref:LysE family translocator n=2 Tax=Roseomonas genomospecies 6 TaxID=214106 RepID=A0A9W7NJG2_9PROT|nr:LysE family translocator [Roseomonas genomospecies 6]
MGFDQVLLLASACFVAMASPGPGVFAVVSRSMAIGSRRTMGFIGGMVLGDLVLLGLAMSGLAAVATVLGDVFQILTYLAAAYLIHLGVGCWRHATNAASLPSPSPSPSNARGFVGGFAITLSNPKTILFYMAFLPAFVDLSHLTLPDTVLVALVVGGVLFGVMTTYSVASATARALFRSPRALMILNRTAACLMVATGLFIAFR